jgi:hypothetical protein
MNTSGDGMGANWITQVFLDSRLRGNDGENDG